MTASPRVEAVLRVYRTLSPEQQSIVRDMVELAYRRLLAERLEASVPFKIPTETFLNGWASRSTS
jgi:hypothetical protein